MSQTNEQALIINTMTDGDAHRVADALRALNHLMVGKVLPTKAVTELADDLESLLQKAGSNHPKRERVIGEESAVESGYDYGGGTFLAYRPISGKCNALAAPMQYFRDGNLVRGRILFGDAFEGPPGFCHGGYIAAYLDELFGIVMSNQDMPAMTGTLTTIYRLPVPINRDITYEGWMDRKEGRKSFLKAKVIDADGNLYAEGEAIFIDIDPAIYAAFNQQR